MRMAERFTGFAIALAWPQTFCKQPGSWYDPVTRWLGINRNNYYRAGHAALVLVDGIHARCHYFDFGRYHAPFKHGRVRSAETDHDLEMKTIPKISENGKAILNFHEILKELQLNPACHGEGPLHASYGPIDFDAALNKALQMQSESPTPYGPFISGGSNCSRFVNTVILSGKPGLFSRIRLKYLIPLTPTPLNNVHALHHRTSVDVLRVQVPFLPVLPLSRPELTSTLPQPVRHPAIPGNAQWLSGEGAGSWFAFSFEEDILKVTRYSPDGTIECRGNYKGPSEGFLRVDKEVIVDYPSNCKEVVLKVDGLQILFCRIYDDDVIHLSSISELPVFSKELLF